MLLLLARERHGDAFGKLVVFEHLLHFRDDGVGVGALFDSRVDGDDSVEVVALHGREGRRFGRRSHGADGNLLNASRALVAERDFLVHQALDVVAEFVGKAKVDGVVVFFVLVAADFLAKEGGAQGVADLAGAHAQAAGLGAVHGYRKLGLVSGDVELEFVVSFDARIGQRAAHVFGDGEQFFVVVARQLNVDRSSLGRTVLVFFDRNQYPRDRRDVVAKQVEHFRARHAVAVLVFAVLGFAEGDHDLGLVGRGDVGGTFARVARSLAHLGNDRLDHVVVGLSVDFVLVFFNQLQDLVFNFLGDFVGLLDVGTHRHFDVDVGQVGLVVGEEDHFGRNNAHQHEAQDEEADRRPQGLGGVVFGKHPRHLTLVPGLELRKPVGHEAVRPRLDAPDVDQREESGPKEQVAQRSQAHGHVQNQAEHGERRTDFGPLGPVDHVCFHFHVARGQCRIDHQGHEERGAQYDNQGKRQILHEFADESGPKGERNESGQGGGRRRNDGHGDFARAQARRLVGAVAQRAESVDVLDNNDSVVDEHAQRQHEPEEDHEVEGYAHAVENQEAQKHRKRNGDAHKQGVAQAQEEGQYQYNQDDAKNDGVLEFAYLVFGAVRLVVGNRK